MALSRITVWTAGQVLTAAALEGEFNNILGNPIALISPTTGNINYANNQAVSFALENVSADPVPGNTGRIVFNTGKQQPQVDDGTVIRTIPALKSTDITQGDLIVSASSGSGTFKPIPIGNTGQALVVTSSGGQVGWGTPSVAGGGGYAVRGLTGGNVTTSQAASFEFDYAQLRSSAATATFQMNATSSWLVNVGVVGVGGRDQAGAFASTFVHVYAVSTGANSTTPLGLLSTVAPPVGPTLPSSCSAWTYVATLPYSSASTSFDRIVYARGAEMKYGPTFPVLADGLSTTQAQISISSAVPANALQFSVNMDSFMGGTGAAFDVPELRVVTGVTYWKPKWTYTGAQAGSYSLGAIPNVSQTLYYIWPSAAPGAQAGLSIDINGYRVANGDM